MRKKSIMDKKYLLIGLFILLIGGVGIGFALLEASVHINGNAKIDAVTWGVQFADPNTSFGENVTLAADDVAPHIVDGTNNTEAEWTVTLAKPGDKYKFTIDVVNVGSLDAKLTGVSAPENYNLDLTTAQDVFLNYSITSSEITGQNQSPLPAKSTTATNGETLVLKAGKKYRLTFEIEYDSNITAEQIPSAQTINLGYKLDFQQNS